MINDDKINEQEAIEADYATSHFQHECFKAM